jgi:hypothetical protein
MAFCISSTTRPMKRPGWQYRYIRVAPGGYKCAQAGTGMTWATGWVTAVYDIVVPPTTGVGLLIVTAERRADAPDDQTQPLWAEAPRPEDAGPILNPGEVIILVDEQRRQSVTHPRMSLLPPDNVNPPHWPELTGRGVTEQPEAPEGEERTKRSIRLE